MRRESTVRPHEATPYSCRMLGMARRAGLTVVGQDRVRQALRRGRVALVLLASDGSARTRRTLTNAADAAGGVTVRTIVYSKEVLGASQGMASCSVLGLVPGDMKKTIERALEEECAFEK